MSNLIAKAQMLKHKKQYVIRNVTVFIVYKKDALEMPSLEVAWTTLAHQTVTINEMSVTYLHFQIQVCFSNGRLVSVRNERGTFFMRPTTMTYSDLRTYNLNR